MTDPKPDKWTDLAVRCIQARDARRQGKMANAWIDALADDVPEAIQAARVGEEMAAKGLRLLERFSELQTALQQIRAALRDPPGGSKPAITARRLTRIHEIVKGANLDDPLAAPRKPDTPAGEGSQTAAPVIIPAGGISLLLYLETCAVDYGGRMNRSRINDADFKTAQRWAEEGFIGFGRIRAADINEQGAHWVHLSEAAWDNAARCRRARADRMWMRRNYQTTKEAQGG